VTTDLNGPDADEVAASIGPAALDGGSSSWSGGYGLGRVIALPQNAQRHGGGPANMDTAGIPRAFGVAMLDRVHDAADFRDGVRQAARIGQ
jgi:hypothetical protein